MNKKEKEILEKRVLESELECLEAEENMKSDKSKLEYLKNQGSYNFIAHKYGMASSSQLKRWVVAYNNFGNTGLKRLESHRFYSFSAKLSVAQCYLTGKVSYQKLALRMGINNPSIIV